MKDFSNFEYFLDPILIVNKDLTILYCNGSVESLLKLSEKRIVGKKILDLINFDEKTRNDILIFKSIQNRLINLSFKTGQSGKAFFSFYSQDAEHFVFYLKDQTVEDSLYAQTKVYIKDLQNYSKELEFRVEERTKEIYELSKNQSALLNSVSQGFFIFNKIGTPIIYSKACEHIFDQINKKTPVADILKIELNFFDSWVCAMYDENIPFEDIKDLGPKSIVLGSKTISLDFYPIRKDDGRLENIVAVATDISDKVYLQKVFKEESEKSKKILSILKRKDQLNLLIEESQNIINKMFLNPNDEFLLHTLKGISGSFHLFSVSEYIHELENNLKEGKNATSADVEYISRLFSNFYKEVEEIIGSPNDLRINKSQVQEIYKLAKNNEDFKNLNNIFNSVSLKSILSGFSEVVNQLALDLKKKIDPIDFIGDIKLSQNKHKDVINQLIHIFRNIIDHGIEFPEDRIKKKKKEHGKITITLIQESNLNCIEISDDGAGVDLDKIKSKFNCKDLTDEECLMKIFENNVSLKEEVSEISGRGIGLASVRDIVEKNGGKITLTTKKDKGTSFKIFLPI